VIQVCRSGSMVAARSRLPCCLCEPGPAGGAVGCRLVERSTVQHTVIMRRIGFESQFSEKMFVFGDHARMLTKLREESLT
jgi:hypothetical protein